MAQLALSEERCLYDSRASGFEISSLFFGVKGRVAE